jgi:DeoD family purine-nucleoside phosphorylase
MSRGLPAADALSSRPLAMVPNPVHIHPTAELADRVLLPGDPGRALRLAQALLDEPKMLNHNRGLWGYTGTAADGRLLSIQSTGMGGPSAAIVATELIELGAGRLLRIGTCGGLDPELEPGQLLIVSEAIADDGTSQALGRHGPLARIAAPGTLTEALQSVGDQRIAAVVSADLFYGAEDRVQSWIAAGALAVEMEAATIFTVAARHRVEAGCALLVSNMAIGEPRYLDPEALHTAELRLGELALAALSR